MIPSFESILELVFLNDKDDFSCQDLAALCMASSASRVVLLERPWVRCGMHGDDVQAMLQAVVSDAGIGPLWRNVDVRVSGTMWHPLAMRVVPVVRSVHFDGIYVDLTGDVGLDAVTPTDKVIFGSISAPSTNRTARTDRFCHMVTAGRFGGASSLQWSDNIKMRDLNRVMQRISGTLAGDIKFQSVHMTMNMLHTVTMNTMQAFLTHASKPRIGQLGVTVLSIISDSQAELLRAAVEEALAGRVDRIVFNMPLLNAPMF